MKKFKILAISAVVATGLIAGCSAMYDKFMEEAFKVQPNYADKYNPVSPIEKIYAQKGSFAVAGEVFPSNHDKFKTFKIWYPSDIVNNNKRYPVIVSANGTGFPYQKYEPVLARLASWGFVVIANDDPDSWNGLTSSLSLDKLNMLNSDKNSVFYGKLNTQNAGIIGHSQGGVAVFNTLTKQPNRTSYKAAISLSPTNLELAKGLKWDYDPKLVQTPIMLLSGEGGGDDWVVKGEQLAQIYQMISSEKVMMRRKKTGHGETLYAADGYVTAWFMWKLQNDSRAAQAFTGAKAEILNNPLYSDVKIR